MIHDFVSGILYYDVTGKGDFSFGKGPLYSKMYINQLKGPKRNPYALHICTVPRPRLDVDQDLCQSNYPLVN